MAESMNVSDAPVDAGDIGSPKPVVCAGIGISINVVAEREPFTWSKASARGGRRVRRHRAAARPLQARHAIGIVWPPGCRIVTAGEAWATHAIGHQGR